MVNRVAEISDPYILEAINAYGFGAVIEVTNGIPHVVKRQEKKRQVKRAKQILRKRSDDDAKVIGGLALIKTGSRIKSIRELDFIMRLTNYNPTLLTTVAEEILESADLLPEEHERLRFALERQRKFPQKNLASYLTAQAHGPRRGSKGKLLSPRNLLNKEYAESLAKLKGFVLEAYVQRLFENALPHDSDYYTATHVQFSETSQSNSPFSIVDLVIASYEQDFLDAMQSIQKKFKQSPQRIVFETNKDSIPLSQRRKKEKPYKRPPATSVHVH
jgi:prolyl oligopeptidase PreP (S9A serine peptidase family)